MKKIVALTFTTLISINSYALEMSVETGFDSIYGTDDREFISEATPIRVKRLAKSVAYLIPTLDGAGKNSIIKLKGNKTLVKTSVLSETAGVCSDVKFAKEKSRFACSAFLIAPDTMLTAGHCIEDNECGLNGKKFVFDVTKDKTVDGGFLVNTNDIYSCSKVLKRRFEIDNDYAIVKLSRRVKDRPALKMNQKDSLSAEDKVFMVGHPMGLAQIYSPPGEIYHLNKDYESFFAKIDSFNGNSGSPVFNAKTLEVEGILISGQEDLYEDNSRNCNYNVTHEDGGEGIMRIKYILDLLKK